MEWNRDDAVDRREGCQHVRQGRGKHFEASWLVLILGQANTIRYPPHIGKSCSGVGDNLMEILAATTWIIDTRAAPVAEECVQALRADKRLTLNTDPGATQSTTGACLWEDHLQGSESNRVKKVP